jgi:transposase
MARQPSGTEWSAVGSAHGGAVEGSATALRFLPDLPSPLSAMAALRSVGRNSMGIMRGSAGAWATGFRRGICRCLVQRGKKGGDRIGPTRCGKGSKIMAIADSHGLPVAIGITSASPNESTLVDQTLDQRHIDALPKRIIGDKGYDSDPLDGRMRQRGIEMIAPNRAKRKKTQDRRPLRRYIRRWRVERLFAWLKNYRRIGSRWERNALNFLGMVQLGCLLILMRHL